MEKIRDLKAAICTNGHLQDSTLEISDQFDFNYCQVCSSPIIDECPNCKSFIRGSYVKWKNYYNKDIIEDLTAIPNYCYNCAEPYPWMEKFLREYKEILELQTEDLDKTIQNNIYKATEEAIKQKFTGNSTILLGLHLKKLAPQVKGIMVNLLTNVATSEAITLLNK